MPACGADKSLPSVPRSKGCITCVSRKTRCDGRRPTCRACEDRKQICRGYRRPDFVFLNDGWRAPGVAARERKGKTPVKVNQRKAFDLNSTAPTSPDPRPDLVLHKGPSIERYPLYVAYFLSGFATPVLGPSNFIVTLFEHYFKLLPFHSSDSTVKNLPSITPVVFAVDALAQGHFGRANGDLVSEQHSIRKYGMALRLMSPRLLELQILDPNLQSLSEDDWQHLAFFCMVMAFWELKMSPNSNNWQNHIRGLASTIFLRGRNHTYSENNLRLLATSRLFVILQTLSSRDPGFLSNDQLQLGSSIRSAWQVETKATSDMDENLFHEPNYKLYLSLDHLMTVVTTVVPIMARYDKLLTTISSTALEGDADVSRTLMDLYHTAETILYQAEELWERWDVEICEVPLTEWLSRQQDMATSATCRDQFWSTIGWDIPSLFDKALSFRSMKEYQAIALYRTIVMSLRLLLRDMLSWMIVINPPGMPANPNEKINQHRLQLISHAEKVLQAIYYVSIKENMTIAPFFLATPWQMAIVTMETECQTLRARGRDEAGVNRYERMKGLAVRYMDWAMQSKIPIKIDVDSGCYSRFSSTNRLES